MYTSLFCFYVKPNKKKEGEKVLKGRGGHKKTNTLVDRRNRHMGPHSAASNKIRKYIIPTCNIYKPNLYISKILFNAS